MAGSVYGTIYRISTFGESHGAGVGAVIDGLPAGFELDLDRVQEALNRRRPGQSAITTDRDEQDSLEVFSGLFEGKTTGAPLAFIVKNKDQRSTDYDHNKDTFRPSHADFTYDRKFGIRDHRGGGRSSARETIARVVAGAIAQQYLESKGLRFSCYVDQVGTIRFDSTDFFERSAIEANIVRCPNQRKAQEMEALIAQMKEEGDTVGGGIRCVIEHVPEGLGEPVFDKLHAELAKAMLSINAVKGFEYGSGFASIEMKGSEHNDSFSSDGSTKSNHSGGIQGGITNGMPIYFRVAFKPVATIMKDQETINKAGESVVMTSKGRHDACVVPRAVPIVESMAANVLFDFLLRAQVSKWQ